MHPIEDLYCPACGGTLEHRFIEEEGRDRQVCTQCSRIHYINPKVVAGTVPVRNGRVWLLRRSIEPRHGFWTFPAGFMEMQETVRDAAMRETREELNLEVQLRDLLGIYSRSTIGNVLIVYHADALGEPSAGSEALDIGLFGPEAIPWDDLAFWNTRDALRDWIQQLTR
ncbi:MAG: NUDIX hydrolase [Chloroflexota bacterium]